jgi:hypothetical protein
MSPSPRLVRFSYEDTTLPGWWIPAEPGTADPLAVTPTVPRFHGGFDSTEEELYFARGATAARRGYHVFALGAADRAAPFVTRSEPVSVCLSMTEDRMRPIGRFQLSNLVARQG